MDGDAPRRALECDCGYVAYGADDDELVAAVQAHALEVHGMNLPADLILALPAAETALVDGVAPAGEATTRAVP